MSEDHTAEFDAVPHEFDEDVNDASMCMCGVPAIYHDRVFPGAPS